MLPYGDRAVDNGVDSPFLPLENTVFYVIKYSTIKSIEMKKITLKDLHEINNKFPELKDIHLSHQYDTKTKDWKFVGYKCSKCGRTFKRIGFVDKHEDSCKPPVKLNRDTENNLNIRTLSNDKWKPFI